MDKITAPFTEEQIINLNKYQQTGHAHPFTCCSHNGCNRMEHDEGVLKATLEGWVCPCGKYTQDWAHAFMAEAPLETLGIDFFKSLLQKQRRVPKFRAWDKEHKIMWRPIALTELVSREWEFQSTDGQFSLPANDFDQYVQSNTIWMEFTGRVDSKGNEIYEGDILRDTYEDKAEPSESYTAYVQVVFQDGSFGWLGETTNQFYPFYAEDLESIEIAGNIYQNPELLKK